MSSVDAAADAMANLSVSNKTEGAPSTRRFLSPEEEGIVNQAEIDKFQWIDTIGTGTFGIVRLCRLEGVDRPLSMKILSKSQLLRLNQEVHIISERDVLTKIRHPFVVTLYRTFASKSYLYMLMEFIPGGEIFYHLRRANFYPQPTAQFYAAQIVLVLEYLHSLQIAYRDLKPENLLLGKNGYIRVVDFGFAKHIPKGTRSYTMCGTPEYLAPEIIITHGHGLEVDWWALGIFMYEMLIGSTPFYHDNQSEVYNQVLASRISFPSSFDPVAKDIVRRLLIPDPSARFGCLHNGAADVRRHKFFRGVNWQGLYGEEIKAPFIPPLRSEWDTSQFEEYPEEECALPPPGNLSAEEQALFAKF